MKMTLEEFVKKYNGKKVDFDGAKIALAIKKGFDNIVVQDEEIDTSKSYTEKDIQKVYQAVINRIVKEYKNEDKINHDGSNCNGLRNCTADGDADSGRNTKCRASCQKTAGARANCAQIRQKDAL